MTPSAPEKDGHRAGQISRGRIAEIVAIAVSYAIFIIALYLRGWKTLPGNGILPTYLAVVVVIGGYIFIRVVTAILEKSVEPRLGATRTHGIKNLLQIVSAIFIVFIIFSIFGLNLTSVLIGAGFLGIVLGLAAQQVLGNVFAGISILISRPFEIGDRVMLVSSSYGLLGTSYAHENQVNGITGVIQDIGIFLTRVMLDDGTPSAFPNSVIISSMIINYSLVTWRKVRVRMDLNKDSVDFDAFRSRMLDGLKRFDIIDVGRTKIEMVDAGTDTYAVVIVAWAHSSEEEPIKSLILQQALQVQKGFMAAQASPSTH